MSMNKNKNTIKIALLTLGTFGCLIVVNYEIERMIKQPYQSNINFHKEIFISPTNLLSFTSAIIWISVSIWKFYSNYQSEHDQDQNVYTQSNSFDEQQLQKIYVNKTKDSLQQSQSQEKSMQGQEINIQSLPFLQIFKIVIPKYFQIICFFYATTFLSFPQVLIFNILSKFGLISLYQAIFNEGNNKCMRLFCSLSIFFGFGLFNITFVDNSKTQNDQNLFQKQTIYGYMFAIGMCYLGVMKNILRDQVNEKYGKLPVWDSILLQSKTNCILSYLISVYLNEQIYSSVFAVLHTDFLLNIIGFSFVLFAGLLMKQQIKKCHVEIKDLIVILQKGFSLIFSLIFFQHGINETLVLSISIIVLMTFIRFVVKYISSHQNDETSEITKENQQLA